LNHGGTEIHRETRRLSVNLRATVSPWFKKKFSIAETVQECDANEAEQKYYCRVKNLSFIKNISNQPAGDNELVALYKRTHDLNVLGELFQRYMDLLYAVCLKYFKEPETAKDAVMAIFEELAPKLQKHEVGNFKGWLYTVAKNYCLMQLRSAKNIITKEFDAERMQLAEDVHLNGVFEKEMHLTRLSECLETLPAEQKTSVELFYLQEKCYKEIAETTGLEWNKVRSMIQNGRRNLKICMDNKEAVAKND
jgi:RNA polymerase sigma factor (sigma-70 family)